MDMLTPISLDLWLGTTLHCFRGNCKAKYYQVKTKFDFLDFDK